MSSDGQTPLPRISVFISYASEDRPAARLLRDRITAAGLDVWYDENELGGGDTWDQKIRRQIRECDYFMPVISATTDRRREGYFRREWRIAVERTLDMADDVLFLLPVVIDETLESSARVPEKFLSVQWLRAPGGTPTARFDALLQRLLAGDPIVASRPPLTTRPPVSSAVATIPPDPAPAASGTPRPPVVTPATRDESRDSRPPPMPPFPHAPEGGAGHWVKFVAEVIWWALTAAWLVVVRLPRWVRVVLSVWLVFLLIGTCQSGSGRKSAPPTKRDAPSTAADIARANAAAEKITAVFEKSGKPEDWGKVGDEIARKIGNVLGQVAGLGKALVAAPFPRDADDAAVTQFARAVFSSCYGHLAVARPNDVSVASVLPESDADASLASLGRSVQAGLVLGARFTKNADDTRVLAVRVIRSETGAVAWSADFPVATTNPSEAGARIAEAIVPLLPGKK